MQIGLRIERVLLGNCCLCTLAFRVPCDQQQELFDQQVKETADYHGMVAIALLQHFWDPGAIIVLKPR